MKVMQQYLHEGVLGRNEPYDLTPVQAHALSGFKMELLELGT